MEHFVRDLRFACRSLARTPLFALVAVLTLGFGIGVNATIFTFVNAVLLRPLPVERPETLVTVYTSWPEEAFGTSSYPDYLDLRDGTDAFSGLLGHASAIATLQHHGRSQLLIGEMLTGNAFQVLGIEPAEGRLLVPADDVGPEAPRVVVLGHGLWQRRFGGDPGVVGSAARLNGELYQVVGVAPASFPGLLPGVAADFWVPAVRVDEIDAAGQINSVHGDPGRTLLERRGYRWMWLKGRLRPGVGMAQATTQLATVMARIAREHPLTNDGHTVAVKRVSEVRYHPEVDRVLQPVAAVLLAAVGLVLLVVCANLANMLLSRAQGRRREVAIRLALGAGQGRLVRQLMTESLLLALAGGAFALLLARWSTRLLLAYQPPIPFSVGLDVGVDGRVVVFTLAVSMLAAVVFGLLPARQASRVDLVSDLRQGTGATGGGSRRFGLKNALVVAQVAVSLVLLVGAGLLVRGLGTARSIDVGFEPGRVAALGLNLGMSGYQREEGDAFLRTLRDRVASLPGVASAALATRVPFDVNIHNNSIYPEDLQLAPDHPGFSLDVTWVDSRYFDTIGVPLLQGRVFTSADTPDTPGVAVVNQAMARRFWNGQALGERFREGAADGDAYQVVGVVADYKVRTVGEEPRPMVHYARSQHPSNHAYLLARSAQGDAGPLIADLRRTALEMDPELAFTDTTTLAGFMAVSLYPVRMGASLLGAFGLLALVLASLGLYGVLAYSVSRRAREMGIRIALGARPGDVLRLVVRDGMVLVAVGVMVGLALAAASSRALAGLLYGRSPFDPIAFGGAVLVLLTVALLANWLPAARASRSDPVEVLRQE